MSLSETEKNEDGALCFTVAGKRFRLPVSETERIISLPRSAVSPIPFGLDRTAFGLFSFRGVVYPLAKIAGVENLNKENAELTVILLKHGGNVFGIPVDGVSEASDCEADNNSIAVNAEALYNGRLVQE